MKKAITIVLAFVLGFQMLSAQRYYCRKGLEYLNIDWRDSAFRTFKEGMDHGELASTYYVIICYIAEIGTPTDIPKAESLMAKYYTKSPEICILAANYFAGFKTMDSNLRSIYWREYYSGRKNDPALALKYAHYFLDHWDIDIDSQYYHSGSFDAFRVIMDYEIRGLLFGTYGFKKDPSKAIAIYKKWVGKDSISGRNAMAFGFECSYTFYNGWTVCLFRQIKFYSEDTRDFINKCNLLRNNGFTNDIKKEVNFDTLADYYPGPGPYKWEKQNNVHNYAYYIGGCQSLDQLNQLYDILKDFALLDDYAQTDPYIHIQDAIKQKRQLLARMEEAQYQEIAIAWYETHKSDNTEAVKTEYDKQVPKVQAIISDLFANDVVDYTREDHTEEDLLALRNHPLASQKDIEIIDSAIEAVRNEKWSKDLYETIKESRSIPDLMEFMKNPRITKLYMAKSEELLAQIKIEQTEARDKKIKRLVSDFEASVPTTNIKEDDLALGSFTYEASRDCFKKLRESFNALQSDLNMVNAEYPDLEATYPAVALENKYSDQLAFADLIIMEDKGNVSPMNYEFMMDRRPNLYPSYIQDHYAIARASSLTKNSTNKDIKAVKQLPMSEVAKRRVTELTKKSYLSKK